MSIQLMTAAWRMKMPAAKKLVLLALCDWSNDEGANLYPSIAAIAGRCSVSESTARRLVHDLINDGLLTVIGNHDGGRPGATRRYQLNAKAIYDGCQIDRGVKLTAVETGVKSDNSVSRRVSNATETGVTGDTLTVNKATTNKARAKEKKGACAPIDLPPWLPADAWSAWCDYRKARGKGWTAKAQELSIRRLQTLREAGHEPQEVIDQSILSGWAGLFPVKEKQNERTERSQSGRRSALGRTLDMLGRVSQTGGIDRSGDEQALGTNGRAIWPRVDKPVC